MSTVIIPTASQMKAKRWSISGPFAFESGLLPDGEPDLQRVGYGSLMDPFFES
jgi:hypothetical protein